MTQRAASNCSTGQQAGSPANLTGEVLIVSPRRRISASGVATTRGLLARVSCADDPGGLPLPWHRRSEVGTGAGARVTNTPSSLAIEAAGTWADAAAAISPVANLLECGLIVVDCEGRIVLASAPLAPIFGIPVESMLQMTAAEFIQQMVARVDAPPTLLAQGRMLPEASEVVCEEFELKRPGRSVVRWVARRVDKPAAGTVVICTDITTEVDLIQAFEQMAVTDRLTGLANRRGTEIVLRREVAQARRYGSPLCVLMFDIDQFKQLNDTHGHAVGDLVLQGVARLVSSLSRSSDLLGRWGGEEFLLVLPGTDIKGAGICAERVRVAVSSATFSHGTTTAISGGIAELSPEDDIDSLLKRADEGLYAAKRAGRNRIR